MGKQCKKKKGLSKKDKAAHKAKVQDRKERAHESAIAQANPTSNAGNNYIDAFTLIPGDRVWFFDDYTRDENDPHSYRGILRSIPDGGRYVNDNGICEVQPLSNYFSEDPTTTLRILESNVYRDIDPLTTRYKVGEELVCNTCYGYLPATITHLWPIWEEYRNDIPDHMPCYKLMCYPSKAGLNKNPFATAAVFDDDSVASKRPLEFRFGVGDKVVFDARRANKAKLVSRRQSAHAQGWIAGEVVEVDVLGMKDVYAVYKCAATKADERAREMYYIIKDDDEHIGTAEKSKVRDRFLESIEQGCSFGHLDFLANEFEIDLSPVVDMVQGRALEYGSFDALRWLEERMEVNLRYLRFTDGNTILHEMAASPHALRFFSSLSAHPASKLSALSLNMYNDVNFYAIKNGRNQEFLQVLLDSGNFRAIEMVFSLKYGLFSNIVAKRVYSDLEKFKISGKNDLVSLLCQEFVELETVYAQSNVLHSYYYGKTTEKDVLRKPCMKNLVNEESSIISATKYVRFLRQWDGHLGSKSIGKTTKCLAQNGFIVLFKLFYRVDKSIACIESQYVFDPGVTHNEFLQPEMMEKSERDDEKRILNIIQVVTRGVAPMTPLFDGYHILSRYIDTLNCFGPRITDFDSLVEFFKTEYKESDSDNAYKELIEYQLAILQDTYNIPGRKGILNFLVNEEGWVPPNILDPIRMRECAMFQWVFHNSLKKIDDFAFCDKDLTSPMARKLEFLGGRRVSKMCSLGTFLVFACVELNSLQILAWLVEKERAAISDFVNGFHLLHACAYFGRMEIAIWLHKRPEWGETLNNLATRQGFKQHNAVHIAVERGHTNLADFLLEIGCSNVDGNGKTVDVTAASSSHEHVREWGKEKAGPLGLEKSIKKLFKILEKRDYEAAKKHIATSQCLKPDQWRDADIFRSNEPLPSGATYHSTFLRCVNSDVDDKFALWLCHDLTRFCDERLRFNPCLAKELNEFWNKTGLYCSWNPKHINKTQLQEMSHSYNLEELCQWLSEPWVMDIRMVDPDNVNPIIWNNCLDEKRTKRFKFEYFLIDVYRTLLDRLNNHSEQQIAQGAMPEIITKLYLSYRTIAERLAKVQSIDLSDLFFGIFTDDRNKFINMNIHLCVEYDRAHAVCNHLPINYMNRSHIQLCQIHRVLAIENYDHLIKLSHRNGQGWTESMELEVIRISSFFSHTTIVDYFLVREDGDLFLSSLEQSCRAAMLGAAETGRIDDWVQLIGKSGQIDDPLAISLSDTKEVEEDEADEDYEDYEETTRKRKKNQILASPAAMCVYGYIIVLSGCKANQFCSLDNYKAILKNLNENFSYDATTFLRGALYIVGSKYNISSWKSLIVFADLLHSSYGLDPFRTDTRKLVDEITEVFLRVATTKFRMDGKNDTDNERMKHVVFQWLTMIANWGVNIQNVKNDESDLETWMNVEIRNIQTKQRDKWMELNIMKQHLQLHEIQEAVKNGSLNLDAADKGGLRPAHLAAAYNRVDVLQWLVESKKVDFGQWDFASRNVLDVARASKANQAVTWLEERHAKSVIAAFVRKHFMKCLAQRRTARLLASVERFQAQHRGMMVRKRHRGILLSVVEEAQRFQAVWTGIVALLSDAWTIPFCWSSFRDLQQSRVSDKADIEGLLESEAMLGAAMELALEEEEEKEEMDRSDDSSDEGTPKISGEGKGTIQHNPAKECVISTKTMIHLSSEVVKWLRQADVKYREFFVRRIQQLQNGDRSRILAKRLRGSQSTIFETYLEQKSGHRILWQTEIDQSILIWYVAKHKHVSRLVRLIDDSESRSTRQRLEVSSMPELDTRINDHHDSGETASRVVLNPQGNVPLKVYEVKPDSITDVLDAAWLPQLYLSDEERSIVEGSGTILLLGRSGTGKTVCICNRMDLDRQQHQNNNSFSQLFVARSQRLARYVTETVGRHDRCVFTTFGELLLTLETELPDSDSVRSKFLPSQKMNFSRFKKDLYGGTMVRNNKQYIDPMIAWTNIRTFIKGSIEALSTADQTVDKEGFLQLGKKRCRLDQIDRQKVYDIFERYQKVLEEQNLWDDNDRISALLQRLTLVLDSDRESFERVRRSKIYVDEIQDYTQSEILLFFRLCGPGNLFLAGDPAQSVVEGVEFRFEEIRSVGYFVTGPERRDLIPDKPKKVTVNFRSHSGILNTAAAILRRLFDTFPDSAKELGEDRGVFTGPRPGVFHGVPIEQLKRLVSEKLNGIVILTHDERVSYWKRALGGYPLVYGIRGAKGLEFKRVMVLGFFNEIQRDLQKPWRDLLLGREVVKQELESKLKLLYTAVTRCIEQLFFAETVRSVAGDAFVRWATTTSVRSEILATRQRVDNIETMAMTQDEWIASGLDNAEIAESHAGTEIEESLSMFEKALFCFEHGKEEDLARKVRSHKASLLFRRDLQEGKIVWSEDGSENTEFSSALLAEQLVSENLLLEARRLLSLSILPHMSPYTQEQVKKNILSKLPSDNAVYS